MAPYEAIPSNYYITTAGDTSDYCVGYATVALADDLTYEQTAKRKAQANRDYFIQFYTQFQWPVIYSLVLAAKILSMAKRITRQHKTKQTKVLQRRYA
jgi:hypothetical protein